MKNLIVAVALILTGTTFASANCVNGSCTKGPVRRAGVVVLNTTKRVVSAPVRGLKKVQANRAYRYSH